MALTIERRDYAHYARQVLGDERYGNSPCQAHPLELVAEYVKELEESAESLRSQLAAAQQEIADFKEARSDLYEINATLKAKLAEDARQTEILLDSYAKANQRLFERAEAAEAKLAEVKKQNALLTAGLDHCLRFAKIYGQQREYFLSLIATQRGKENT